MVLVVDATVGKSFPRAIDRLEKAGCRLSNEKLPLLDDMARVNAKGGVQPAEAFAIHRDLLDRRADDIDPNVRARLERARNISAADFIAMVRERAELIRAMDARLADVDVLCWPTTPIVAPTMAEVAAPDDFARKNAMAAAQHVDRQFLRSLRHFAAAAARGRPAHRADAGGAQRPRPPAVSHRRGGREVAAGLIRRSELAQRFQQQPMPLRPSRCFKPVSCCAASAFARASSFCPSRVSCSACRRPSAEEGRRWVSAAPLQPVQQTHQPRALDAQRGGDFRLRQSGIGADHHQHRELRRAEYRCARAAG